MDVSAAEGINAGESHHACKVLGEVSASNWISCGFSSALTERSACKKRRWCKYEVSGGRWSRSDLKAILSMYSYVRVCMHDCMQPGAVWSTARKVVEILNASPRNVLIFRSFTKFVCHEIKDFCHIWSMVQILSVCLWWASDQSMVRT